jgi:ABC-type nitrate/sulfonate/bicarbonate transport system substrate-binding protein
MRARRWASGAGWLVLTAALAACGAASPAPSGSPAAPASSAAAAKPASASANPGASAAAAASAKPEAPASGASARPAASTAAKPAASASANAVKFNYGISTPSPETILAWTAQAQGFDKQNGIELSIVNAEGGSKGLQVLLSGEIQAMEVGLAPVVIANSSGADFRVIDSHANAIPFSIVGAKDVTADNAKQKLKGSKIGISTFGSESDVSVNLYLDKLGLVRDTDVAVVQVGGTAQRLAAMVSGAISAAPLLQPDVVTAKSQGFNELIDLSKDSAWVFNAAVVSKPYLDAHRDQELSLLKAFSAANAYARSHPDDAKKILAQQLKYSDQKLVDAAYDEFMKVAPADMRPTTAGIQEVLKQVPAVTKDLKLKSTSPSDYVDLSLLDQLK